MRRCLPRSAPTHSAPLRLSLAHLSQELAEPRRRGASLVDGLAHILPNPDLVHFSAGIRPTRPDLVHDRHLEGGHARRGENQRLKRLIFHFL